MIIHVDMDAFYASVEQRDFPELKGKPVLVGGVTKRSVVAAASYEARPFGCRSAQSMKEALRRCPHAIVQPPRFSVYREIARQIRDIFSSFTPLVEPLALDEAFLDVAGSVACLGSPEEMGRQIKKRIQAETQLIASVGIAPVKFVAKIASDRGKPDGLVMVGPNDLLDFLAPLPVELLWGVGKATLPKLHQLGIQTLGDLRSWPAERIQEELGNAGKHWWDLAHGIDPRPVVAERQPKSISHEETFDDDLTSDDELLRELHALTDEVAQRLRADGFVATTITVKIRRADFQTVTRQTSLDEPTDQTKRIWESVEQIWRAWRRPKRLGIRLLGVGVSGLAAPGSRQLSLFDEEQDQAQHRIDQTLDAIRQRFGNESLRSADLLRRPPRS